MHNPFEFKYPDDILPNDVIDLFVPVFGEYYNVPISGHTFINGARGSGKSMMLRYMKPDCQILVNNAGKKLSEPRSIKDLDYFSIYIPIKKGHLNKTDIELNNKHGAALLNEHFMVIQFSLIIFKELSEIEFNFSGDDIKALIGFHNKIFNNALLYSGYENANGISEESSSKQVFENILNTLKQVSKEFQHEYLKKLIGANGPVPYNGPIFLYSEFLFEILQSFRRLPFMPKAPIYLLIDDADELNIIQRKILNSWVSLRTSFDISLKISTQLKYKIYTTINDSRIDTPHDYAEINLNDIYTTKKDLYYERIKEIVSKRLNKYQFKYTDPLEFFPEDEEQQQRIEALKKRYIEEKISEGLTKEQAFAFAYRYSVPDYIKNLKGNRYTYSYAGFQQLVNVSSGIIREFIDFASEMYVSQFSDNNGEQVEFITPRIQDKEIKRYSDKKLDSEFEKYKEEATDKKDMDKLRNLIHSMGGLFKVILSSNASERRVFSIALNNEPSDNMKNILDLGVQLGYLQKSLIGNKHGTDKSRLYILNRILAPHFGLDPSSFAGYKFMASEILEIGLTEPIKFIERLKKTIKGAENQNPTLFTDNN